MISLQDFTIILIRILAAYMLLQALSILPMSITIGTANSVMFLISHEFVTFIISTSLWFLAPWLSRKMVKGLAIHSKPTRPLSRYQIEALIISSVGLIILVLSIPQLVNMVTYNNSLVMIDDPALKAQVVASSKGFTGRYIAKMLVGIFCLFFSEKLSFFIQQARKKI